MSDERHPDPAMRRAQRVLLMVHELHKRGYQKLRVCPGLSPSGAYWRCAITPVSNVLITHGALVREYDVGAHYSTADENRFFGWPDAQQDSARALATKFIERFRDLVSAGKGLDWPYAGWYVSMLGFADQGQLPIAYADWYDKDPDYLAKTRDAVLPFPPPGEAYPESEG